LREVADIAERTKTVIDEHISADYNDLSFERYQRLKSAMKDAIATMHESEIKILPIMR
jgi:hypothetical protein